MLFMLWLLNYGCCFNAVVVVVVDLCGKLFGSGIGKGLTMIFGWKNMGEDTS